MEQFAAAAATWEGWATWLSGRVAEDLGYEEAFWKLSRVLGFHEDGSLEPGMWSVAFRYGQGYFFMDVDFIN